MIDRSKGTRVGSAVMGRGRGRGVCVKGESRAEVGMGMGVVVVPRALYSWYLGFRVLIAKF